jgi:hypothetical protein
MSSDHRRGRCPAAAVPLTSAGTTPVTKHVDGSIVALEPGGSTWMARFEVRTSGVIRFGYLELDGIGGEVAGQIHEFPSTWSTTTRPHPAPKGRRSRCRNARSSHQCPLLRQPISGLRRVDGPLLAPGSARSSRNPRRVVRRQGALPRAVGAISAGAGYAAAPDLEAGAGRTGPICKPTRMVRTGTAWPAIGDPPSGHPAGRDLRLLTPPRVAAIVTTSGRLRRAVPIPVARTALSHWRDRPARTHHGVSPWRSR